MLTKNGVTVVRQSTMALLGFVTITRGDVHNQVTMTRHLRTFGKRESLEILVHFLHHLLEGWLLLLGLRLLPGGDPLPFGRGDRIEEPLEPLLLLKALQGEGRGDVMFVKLRGIHPHYYY